MRFHGRIRRRRSNPPRLKFEPPEIDDLMEQIHSENIQHVQHTDHDPFDDEEVEDFVNYVRNAFNSVPPDVFEYRPAFLPEIDVEIPGVHDFRNAIDCWWMKDPVAIHTGLFYPGNDPVPHMSITVSSWQTFQAHIWQNSNDYAGAAPFGAQIACIRFPWVNVENKEPESTQMLVDELVSTNEWKPANQLISLANIGILNVILYNGQPHPMLDGDIGPKGMASLNVDAWGRAWALEPFEEPDPDIGEGGWW